MHVAVWEMDGEARVYGPFPDVHETDGWLFSLGVLIDGDRTRACTAMIYPAYDLRPVAEQTTAARPVKLSHHGTDRDELAYAFVLRMLRKDAAEPGIVGLFNTRDAAVAWWTAQKVALDTEKLTEAQILPLLPIPITMADMARKEISM